MWSRCVATGLTPPATLMNVYRFCGFGYAASNVGVDTVTSPNGAPPFGGENSPRKNERQARTVRRLNDDRRPRYEVVRVRVVLGDERSVLPAGWAGVAGPPTGHGTEITRPTFGCTPVTVMRPPNARPWPPRTLENGLGARHALHRLRGGNPDRTEVVGRGEHVVRDEHLVDRILKPRPQVPREALRPSSRA